MAEEGTTGAANTNTDAAPATTVLTDGDGGGSPPAGNSPDGGAAPPTTGSSAASPEGNPPSNAPSEGASTDPPSWDKFIGQELSEKLKDVKPEEVVKAYLSRPTVPEEYKLPEDFKHKDFAEVAKITKMTQEQVDSVLDFQAKKSKEYNEGVKKLQKEALTEFQKEKGEEWDDVVRLSRGALNYLDEEDNRLRTFLRETGAGAQPIVIDLFAKVGKLLEEDGRLKDDPIPKDGKGKSTAKILYPNMK
jgi:ElaB/YqjD/DUF883 family membrane-anchored ribosome-binding protein